MDERKARGGSDEKREGCYTALILIINCHLCYGAFLLALNKKSEPNFVSYGAAPTLFTLSKTEVFFSHELWLALPSIIKVDAIYSYQKIEFCLFIGDGKL